LIAVQPRYLDILLYPVCSALNHSYAWQCYNT
jgi:hypothetical protein